MGERGTTVGKEFDIVRWHDLEGMSYQAIGDRLGVSKVAAYAAYKKYLEAHPSAQADALREAHNNELNHMRATLAAEHAKAVKENNLSKILEIEKTWLAVLKRQSAFNGMDTNVSLSLSVSDIAIVPRSDYRQRLAPLLPDGMTIDQGDDDGNED